MTCVILVYILTDTARLTVLIRTIYYIIQV